MARTLTRQQLIERSLNKRFREELWQPFIAAIRRYRLIEAGDRIAVCISGGKDSMLLAKLMQEVHRHSDVPFELAFLVMDPGYSAENRQKVEENLALLGIPAEIHRTEIFSDAEAAGARNPCYMCARMRRGWLYHLARDMGCNKIALGHHFDDVIETTVMGMFYGAQIQAMLPMLRSQNFPGMTLIRPLYCIRERDILQWCRYNELSFIRCACRFTEERDAAEDGIGASKRQEIKLLLRELEKTNIDLASNIFNAIHGVQLDTLPGWKTGGVLHSFLERWQQPEGADQEE